MQANLPAAHSHVQFVGLLMHHTSCTCTHAKFQSSLAWWIKPTSRFVGWVLTSTWRGGRRRSMYRKGLDACKCSDRGWRRVFYTESDLSAHTSETRL